MMKYVYRYWILVPLLLLAILSRDWVEDPVNETTESTIDMTKTEADYYLEKFETRKMDIQGKPEYVVTGDTLSHFPEDNSSVIQNPHLVLYREGLVWTMNSTQGILTENPETFFLEGEVSMQREALPTGSNEGSEENLQLQTSNVFVRTEENQVETDKPIKLIAKNWQLSSIGLKTNIETGTLNLLSNVTGRYEVNN